MPGYGIAIVRSTSGLATSRNGAIAAGPSAGSPDHTNMTASDSVPTSSAGTNGAGGSAMTKEIVVSSSGALEAIGTRLRRTSRVAGMNSAPPKISPTG